MELKVIREEKGELEIEVVGESHTFMNALRDVLSAHKDVLQASYRVEHPVLSNPVLYVKTKAKAVPKSMEKKIDITEVAGVGPKKADQFVAAGVKTANDLARAKVDKLAEKTGLSEKVITGHIEDAKALVSVGASYSRVVLMDAAKALGKEFKSISI